MPPYDVHHQWKQITWQMDSINNRYFSRDQGCGNRAFAPGLSNRTLKTTIFFFGCRWCGSIRKVCQFDLRLIRWSLLSGYKSTQGNGILRLLLLWLWAMGWKLRVQRSITVLWMQPTTPDLVELPHRWVKTTGQSQQNRHFRAERAHNIKCGMQTSSFAIWLQSQTHAGHASRGKPHGRKK